MCRAVEQLLAALDLTVRQLSSNTDLDFIYVHLHRHQSSTKQVVQQPNCTSRE
jgi:hypothetical protein